MREKQPLEVQTLYGELVERLVALEARRSIGSVSGCFVTKEVKGESYSYFQVSDPGGAKRQIYLGRKDAVLDRVAARHRTERGDRAADEASVRRVCSILRAGGALATDAASARVLRGLADAGVFRLEGVLVGTHAFVVLGNVLGARWSGAWLRTQDIDIAAEAAMSVAVRDAAGDVPATLEALEMGFLPVPQLDPRSPSTSFKVRGQGLRLDLVTPAPNPRRTAPVALPRLKAAAQPLPFLDFLVQRPVRAAVVNGGGILVNVPDPARFAFHKLIVAGARGAFLHVKRDKDLHQAGQIFGVLVEERPDDVRLAGEEIHRRGRGWVRRVKAGLDSLGRFAPDVRRAVLDIVKT